MSDWAEMWQADDEEDRLAGSVMLPPQEEGPNLYDQALAALGQIPGAEGFATVGAIQAEATSITILA